MGNKHSDQKTSQAYQTHEEKQIEVLQLFKEHDNNTDVIT